MCSVPLTDPHHLVSRAMQDSPAEEAETESNVWDDGSEDVNPFGGGNPGFHDGHYDNPLLTMKTESKPIFWDIGDKEEISSKSTLAETPLKNICALNTRIVVATNLETYPPVLNWDLLLRYNERCSCLDPVHPSRPWPGVRDKMLGLLRNPLDEYVLAICRVWLFHLCLSFKNSSGQSV
ncbi:hypothetical protein Tco_0361177 [Tanacetum coccineum]